MSDKRETELSHVLTEAMEVLAQDAARMRLEAGDDSIEVFPHAEPPDLRAGVPVQLWEQLHIAEGRRSSIDGTGFLASEYQQLLVRLRGLHEYTLKSLGAHSRVVAQSFVDAAYTNLPPETAENAITGGMLAVEAYQIACGHDLTPSFAALTPSEIDSSFAKLPDRIWWGKGLSQKMLDWKEPEPTHIGIFNDVRHIARYTIQNDLAMGHGAVVISDLIATNWTKLFNPDLPIYAASAYANKDQNLPGIS